MGNSPLKSTPLQSALGDWGAGEGGYNSGPPPPGKLGATEAPQTPHWEEYEVVTVDTRRSGGVAVQPTPQVDHNYISQVRHPAHHFRAIANRFRRL